MFIEHSMSNKMCYYINSLLFHSELKYANAIFP